MVKLHLAPVLHGRDLTLGPAPWFRLVRNVLYDGHSAAPVAELRNHQWHADGRCFTVAHADPGSTLHFEGAIGLASREYGPFDKLELVDGALHGDGCLLAHFDEAHHVWRAADRRDAWPIVVVTAPSRGDHVERDG